MPIIFYVDNTAPEVTKVEFNKKDENPIGKILNFLTFGIYSNDTIVMKVTATDSAPTSGLPNDTIKVKNGETEIKDIPPTDIAASNATENGEVTYSFELGNSENAYNLSFNVKDNAGNSSNTVKLYDLVKKGKVVAAFARLLESTSRRFCSFIIPVYIYCVIYNIQYYLNYLHCP